MKEKGASGGYDVILDTDLSRLIETVGSYAVSGWEPQGGIATSVRPWDGQTTFYQAMIYKGVGKR